MVEQAFNHCLQRTESEVVARRDRRRCCTIFGGCAVVSSTKGDGDELGEVAGVDPSGEPNLDGIAALDMSAVQTGGQCRSVVGDHDVVGSEQRCKIGTLQVTHPTTRIDCQNFAVSSIRPVGREHGHDLSAFVVIADNTAESRPTISTAE
jgi:hypothetical protein